MADVLDVIVDRVLSRATLPHTLATITRFDPDVILITSDIAAEEVSATIALVCETSFVAGDFEQRLTLYFRQPAPEGLDSVQIAERIAALEQCACLVSDDSANPYQWLYINKFGEQMVVHLDATLLDEHETYRMVNRS